MIDRLNTTEAIEKRRKKRTMSLETFIQRASMTHDDLESYDWTNVDLTAKDNKKRVTLNCKKHGEFKIRMTHFLNGVGCQYCKGRKKDYNEIQAQLQEIHPTLDFSQAIFSKVPQNYDVEYVCPKHGKKHGNLYNLLNGEGCKECGNELKRKTLLD